MIENFRSNMFRKNKVTSRKRKSNIPNLGKQYKIWIAFFCSCFVMLMISPVFTGETYDFIETEIGDIKSLTQNTPVELIRREWNPENGLLRLDMEIDSSLNNSSLTNIQYEATNRYISNHTDVLDYELLRVNPNYLVLLIKGLPVGFNVLGVGINPTFIEPEIETDDGMENRVIQYYFYEDSIEINNELVESSEESYQYDYLTLQQNSLEEQIQNNINDIRLSKIRIGNIEQSIREAKQDEKYLTEDELQTMNENELNYENLITQEELSIVRFEEEIERWEDRIQLYETQKNDLTVD